MTVFEILCTCSAKVIFYSLNGPFLLGAQTLKWSAHPDNHLDRVFDPVSRIADGRRHLGKREGVRVDQLGVEPLLRHQGCGPVGRTLAFATDAEHVNIVAHEIGEVHRYGVRRKRRKTNSPAAVDHARGFVERVRGARAFEDVLNASPARNALDSFYRILACEV